MYGFEVSCDFQDQSSVIEGSSRLLFSRHLGTILMSGLLKPKKNIEEPRLHLRDSRSDLSDYGPGTPLVGRTTP